MGNHSIACYIGNIEDKGSCEIVNFDPSENEDFVVFDVPAVDVPVVEKRNNEDFVVVEVVESGIKSVMDVVYVGIVFVIGQLHPL